VLCRIEFRHEDGRLIAHLAGRLTGAQVPALLEASDAAPAPILELDELVSADAVGLDALMRLEQRGAQLRGMPEYLRLKMDVLERERKR
jgi:hypothetical protein